MKIAGEITPTMSFPKRGTVVGEIDRVASFVLQIIREFDPRFWPFSP
jgi:hypothetical protein